MIAGTGLNVLLAVLFNLISDLVGGVRITVIEEESARPMPVDGDPRAAGSGTEIRGPWIRLLALLFALGAIAQPVRAHP